MSLFLLNLRHSKGEERDAKWFALITQQATVANPTSQTLGQFSTYFCTFPVCPLKSPSAQNTFKCGGTWI